MAPGEVDTVVYTHLHFDHTGWTTIDDNGAAVPLFPNARHVVQQTEWDYWTGSDELRAAAQYDNVLGPIESGGLLDLVEGEHAVTSELADRPNPGPHPRTRVLRRLERPANAPTSSAMPPTSQCKFARTVGVPAPMSTRSPRRQVARR